MWLLMHWRPLFFRLWIHGYPVLKKMYIESLTVEKEKKCKILAEKGARRFPDYQEKLVPGEVVPPVAM